MFKLLDEVQNKRRRLVSSQERNVENEISINSIQFQNNSHSLGLFFQDTVFYSVIIIDHQYEKLIKVKTE